MKFSKIKKFFNVVVGGSRMVFTIMKLTHILRRYHIQGVQTQKLKGEECALTAGEMACGCLKLYHIDGGSQTAARIEHSRNKHSCSVYFCVLSYTHFSHSLLIHPMRSIL